MYGGFASYLWSYLRKLLVTIQTAWKKTSFLVSSSLIRTLNLQCAIQKNVFTAENLEIISDEYIFPLTKKQQYQNLTYVLGFVVLSHDGSHIGCPSKAMSDRHGTVDDKKIVTESLSISISKLGAMVGYNDLVYPNANNEFLSDSETTDVSVIKL